MSRITHNDRRAELAAPTTEGLPVSFLDTLAQRRAEREARFARLWLMSAEERREAMWANRLTPGECAAWAAQAPEEVPLLDGEWAFIAMHTPEWSE